MTVVRCFRFLGYLISLVLITSGMVTIVGFIDTVASPTNQMIMGTGMFSLFAGGYLILRLELTKAGCRGRRKNELKIISYFCYANLALAIFMISVGAWNKYAG